MISKITIRTNNGDEITLCSPVLTQFDVWPPSCPIYDRSSDEIYWISSEDQTTTLIFENIKGMEIKYSQQQAKNDIEIIITINNGDQIILDHPNSFQLEFLSDKERIPIKHEQFQLLTLEFMNQNINLGFFQKIMDNQMGL